MKYTVLKLDGRFSFNDRFDYVLKWTNSMNRNQGPLWFNYTLQWCTSNWGWSAEIRQYYEILRWYSMNQSLGAGPLRLGPGHTKAVIEPPPECNLHWSWSNGFDDLRIYITSDKELAWFQLAHPVDQK